MSRTEYKVMSNYDWIVKGIKVKIYDPKNVGIHGMCVTVKEANHREGRIRIEEAADFNFRLDPSRPQERAISIPMSMVSKVDSITMRSDADIEAAFERAMSIV